MCLPNEGNETAMLSSRQSEATKVQFDNACRCKHCQSASNNTNSDRSHVALTRLVPCGSLLVGVCQWISKKTRYLPCGRYDKESESVWADREKVKTEKSKLKTGNTGGADDLMCDTNYWCPIKNEVS